MLLDGKWWLRPVTEFSEEWRRPDLDESADGGWFSQELPAHWQELPELATYAGNVVYRRRLRLNWRPRGEQAGRRWWLRLNGIFYFHRVWIDGKLVGSGEGYFFPHEYDITDLVAGTTAHDGIGGAVTDGREHVLVLEVGCPEERDKRGKRLITGVFSHWDAMPPTNPGGIWLPVELFATDELRLKTCLLETLFLAGPGGDRVGRGAAAGNARLRIRVALSAWRRTGVSTPEVLPCGGVSLALEMRPINFMGAVFRRGFRVAVPGRVAVAPALPNEAAGWTDWWHEEEFDFPGAGVWWPHDLGKPRLYEVTLCLATGEGESSDDTSSGDQRTGNQSTGSGAGDAGIDLEGHKLRFRFGVRTVARGKDAFYINGHRHHLKGNNYPPADMRLARVTADLARRDLELAKGAYHNILRVHAHVDHPALYDAADEMGMLLWQDFPLQWLYHPSVFDEAERQAARMIEGLFNHPSIILWCLHNEPVFVVDTKDETRLTRLLSVASSFLFSRNREVLDRRLARLAGRLDPARPRLADSGDLSVWSGGWDSHFYFGWYAIYGKKRAFDRVIRLARRYLRLVSEFGAQSFPNLENARRLAPDTLTEEDWRRLEARHCAQPAIMRRWLDIDAAGGRLADLVRMTQEYQSEINRYYIDRLRSLKFRPNAGILPFMFQDAAPAVSWSVVDYWRQPKSSYFALRDAFRPQYALALLEHDAYRVGQTINAPVWVVNDGPEQVGRGWSVRAVVRGPYGAEHKGEAMLSQPAGGRRREPGDTVFAEVWDVDNVYADGPAVRAGFVRFVPQSTGIYELDLRLVLPNGRTIQNIYRIMVQDTSQG